MQVPEKAIAEIVAEATQRLDDASYISSCVEEFVAQQPSVMQYVVAHKTVLDVEDIVQLLFHASVVHRSIAAALGRSPKTVGYADLDTAANQIPSLQSFSEVEPDIAAYIYSNISDETPKTQELSGRLLAQIGRAMLDCS